MLTESPMELAEYSAQFWTVHASRAPTGGVGDIYRFAQRLFLNCVRLFDRDQAWDEMSTNISVKAASPLYYIAPAGLADIVQLLIAETGTIVNAPGGYYGTALQAASAGHARLGHIGLHIPRPYTPILPGHTCPGHASYAYARLCIPRPYQARYLGHMRVIHARHARLGHTGLHIPRPYTPTHPQAIHAHITKATRARVMQAYASTSPGHTHTPALCTLLHPAIYTRHIQILS
jgi:hypothetical protein